MQLVERGLLDLDAEVNDYLEAFQVCSAEQAKGLLRQAADHEARTILEIAQRIIEQHDTR
jgi:CubicO group peptidase (beta-lactamase class C family)